MKSYPLDIEILFDDDGEPLVYSKGIQDKERFLERARKSSMDLVAELNTASKEDVVYCYGRFEWRGEERYLIPYKNRTTEAGKTDANLFPMTCLFFGEDYGF